MKPALSVPHLQLKVLQKNYKPKRSSGTKSIKNIFFARAKNEEKRVKSERWRGNVGL